MDLGRVDGFMDWEGGWVYGWVGWFMDLGGWVYGLGGRMGLKMGGWVYGLGGWMGLWMGGILRTNG